MYRISDEFCRFVGGLNNRTVVFRSLGFSPEGEQVHDHCHATDVAPR